MISLAIALALLQDGAALSQQAMTAMRESRFADAEHLYRELVRLNPNEPRLRMNLALALHSERKYREAIPEFERVLKANPQPGPAHFLLGVSRLKLDQYCDAIAPLEKAKQWQPSAQVLTELGDAYSGCKRYLPAARVYAQAAAVAPDGSKLTRAAARAFWQAREYGEAKPLFVKAEPQYAGDAEFLFEYGDTLARLEGGEAGLAYLEKAVSAGPSLLPARGALGRVLMELGRAEQSIPHLEAAVGLDATLLMPLSRAYRAVGRAEEAAKAEARYRATALKQ
ncbi:MAG: tetratricopeptide repeat protein [Bryobacteraceae bacterium]